MDCSLPGSCVHGILQARMLEWVTVPFFRGSSQLKDWTQVSCIAGRFHLNHQGIPKQNQQTIVYQWFYFISCQIKGEKVEVVTDFIFLGSKITVDGDCSHEIRWLLLGRKAMMNLVCISLVQFSCSVMFDSLQPHGLQHTKLPCLSPTPGAYSNSCPLSRWYHPTISPSVVPFSSCLQSFAGSGSFSLLQDQGLFQGSSSSHHWPKYWSFNFQWIVSMIKAIVLSVVTYGCESWTIKKAEHWITDAFKPWCWWRLLRVPWAAEIQPVNLKGNQPWILIGRTDAVAEAPTFWSPDANRKLIGKILILGKSEGRQKEKR